MKNIYYFFILIFLLLSSSVRAQQLDTFECDGSYYLITGDFGSSNSDLKRVNLGNYITFTVIANYAAVINSTGFNRKDNLIYGFEQNNNEILRMGKNGNHIVLGPANLPTGGGYVAGDVDSSGTYALEGGNPPHLVKYDVLGPTFSQLSTQQLSFPSGINGNPRFIDIAYHPFTGVLYGFDEGKDQLCTINEQTGEVNPYGVVNSGVVAGALFFDAFGQLFSYGGGEMHRFDVQTGEATLVATGENVGRQDGCSCPYTIKLGKISDPRGVCPGDTFELNYKLRNITSSILSNVDLFDQLPPELTITNISQIYGGTITTGTGVGTNVLSIKNMSLPTDTNTINVSVTIDASNPGGYDIGSQAYLKDLPNFLSDTVFSDDPNTILVEDSTITEIYPKRKDEEIIPNVDSICVGDGLILNAWQPNTTYSWTGPNGFQTTDSAVQFLDIPPAAFGQYHLTAIENQCTIIKDSIIIPKDDCPNEYPCISNFYLSRYANPADSTVLSKINFDTIMTHDSISYHTDSLDAAGYRVEDHFIYAFNNNTRKVIRLFATGNGSILEVDGNLPAGTYEAATVDTAGQYLMTGQSGHIIKMDVGGRDAVIQSSNALTYNSGGSGTPKFGDIAMEPWKDECYGFDENTNRLAIIDVGTGQVNAFGVNNPDKDINSMFFNAFGELFAFGEGIYYEVDLGSGTFLPADTSQLTDIEDGCSCPYKVELQKDVLPRAICPGGEVTYTFSIANLSGQSMKYVQFIDYFPSKATITDISDNVKNLVNPGTGVGFNFIFINPLTLPKDTISFNVKVKFADDLEDNQYFGNQATLKNLKGEHPVIYSDDPNSLRFTDSSNLYVYPTPRVEQQIDLCRGDSFYVGGSWQKGSGTYYDTLNTIYGCDSFVTTQLSFHPNQATNQQAYICQGDSVLVGGSWRKTSGTYYDTLSTNWGCDSVVITEVVVSNITLINKTQEICDGDSTLIAGQWRKQPGTYHDTLPTSGTCDSVIATTLHVHPTKRDTFNVQICEGSSYYAGGANQTTSGTYIDQYTTNKGCDSTLVTNLQVDDVVVNNMSESLCEGETIEFAGEVIGQTGFYTDTFQLTSGCDSIANLTLQVHETYTFADTQFICVGDSILFGGKFRYQAGDYVNNMTTGNGCDSIETLHLQTGSTFLHQRDTAICVGNSVGFGGEIISTSGTYYDTLISQSGCDSVSQLNLTVQQNPTPDLGNDTLICQESALKLNPGGFSEYLWQDGSTDSTFNALTGGHYSVTVTNQHGCEGSDDIFVEVKEPPQLSFEDQIYRCPGFDLWLDASNSGASQFNWSTGDTASAIQIYQPGTYWLRASNGCTATDTVTIIEYDTIAVTLPRDTSLCRNENFTITAKGAPGSNFQWNTGDTSQSITILEKGTYKVTATDPNRCHSSDTFNLTKYGCGHSLPVPTAFSPNGDGTNDHFNFTLEDYDLLEIGIYNRWGERIYHANSSFDGWDGTAAGTPQPMGVYVVVIKFRTRHGEEKIHRSNLTLIR